MNSPKGVKSGVPERVSISCISTCGTRHDLPQIERNNNIYHRNTQKIMLTITLLWKCLCHVCNGMAWCAYIFFFIECFTTTFLRAHSWLNWVDEDDDEDEVGLKEKPEDTRYIKKITSK